MTNKQPTNSELMVGLKGLTKQLVDELYDQTARDRYRYRESLLSAADDLDELPCGTDNELRVWIPKLVDLLEWLLQSDIEVDPSLNPRHISDPDDPNYIEHDFVEPADPELWLDVFKCELVLMMCEYMIAYIDNCSLYQFKHPTDLVIE